MPKQTPDHKIKKIREMGRDPTVTSKAEVAREVEVGRGTVLKYLEEWNEDPEAAEEAADDADDADDEPETDDQADDSAPEGFTNVPPDGEGDADDGPKLVEMDKSEFVLWFFDARGHGVKNNFARRVADQAEIRDELPDETKMVGLLMDGNSGIKNRQSAEMIAENYAAARERYFNARGERPPSGGSWGSPSPQQQGGQGQPGSWDSPPSHGGDTQSFQSGGQGQHGRQQSPQQAQAQQPQAQGGTDPQVAEAISELKDTQRAIMRQMQNSNNQDRQQSLKEQVQEIAEINSTLEALQGNDGSGETEQQVQMLHQQLQELRQEIEAGGDGGGGQVQLAGDGGDIAALASLAANGDIDGDTLGILADSMGVTDPEVKKAEYDYKKAEMKMKNRQEMVDGIFENLGDFSGDIAKAVMDRMGDSDDSDDGGGGDPGENIPAVQQSEPQPNGGQPQAPQQTQPQETAGNMGVGEIQVVGGGPDDAGDEPQTGDDARPTGGVDREGLSPARRKLEEMEDEDDEDDGETSLADRGFNDPGGD